MSHPIIILEGPDACGKTTLGKKFCELHRGRYMHMTLRKEMHLHQVAAITRAVKLAEHQPVIIDRHWPSEQIYAGVYRNGSHLSDEAAFVDRALAELGVFYVGCILSTPAQMVDAHRRSSSERPEMYEPDDRIFEVALGYLDWWEGTKRCKHSIRYCATHTMAERHVAAMRYDYSKIQEERDMELFLKSMFLMATAWRRHAESNPLFKPMLNNPRVIALQCGLKLNS